MLLDGRLDKDAPVGLPLGERALFVRPDEPTVPSDIGRQNGREPAFYALVSQAALRQCDRYSG